MTSFEDTTCAAETSDCSQLELILKLSSTVSTNHSNRSQITSDHVTSIATTAAAANAADMRPTGLLDIVEYVKLLQQLRRRQLVSERRRLRFQSAQLRLRSLLSGVDSCTESSQPEALEEAKAQATWPDVAVNLSAESLRNASHVEVGTKARQPRTSVSQMLYMPEPLDTQPRPPKVERPLPNVPPPPPAGPKATHALTPLASIRLREPLLSLTFDAAGRRLVCTEPSRGIRFRSVTYAGDDLSACDHLDWRLWARAACVLPCGHLLVATAGNLQLLQPDGIRLATSVPQPGITALAVHERSVFALDSWREKICVFELPKLRYRNFHPLHLTKLNGMKQPVALCSLRNLLAIAQKADTLLIAEIDTGRLRQSVHVSSRCGPKQLVGCHTLGMLFVSVFLDHTIFIFKLKGGMFDRAGSVKDPVMKPGPMAWMPGSSILFCVVCMSSDARNIELRSLALHESQGTNWTPKVLRLMKL